MVDPIDVNLNESPEVNYTSTKQSKYTASVFPLNNSTFYSNNNNMIQVPHH